MSPHSLVDQTKRNVGWT